MRGASVYVISEVSVGGHRVSSDVTCIATTRFAVFIGRTMIKATGSIDQLQMAQTEKRQVTIAPCGEGESEENVSRGGNGRERRMNVMSPNTLKVGISDSDRGGRKCEKELVSVSVKEHVGDASGGEMTANLVEMHGGELGSAQDDQHLQKRWRSPGRSPEPTSIPNQNV